MNDSLFTEEKRISFVKKGKRQYKYNGRKVEHIRFTFGELAQFVGRRDAATLSIFLGGYRFRLAEKTYKKKTLGEPDKWPTGKHWACVDKDFLNDLIGEQSADVLWRHLKGVYIFIPESKAKLAVKRIEILEMAQAKERKKEIARRMHMKQSTLSEFTKRHAESVHKHYKKKSHD